MIIIKEMNETWGGGSKYQRLNNKKECTRKEIGRRDVAYEVGCVLVRVVCVKNERELWEGEGGNDEIDLGWWGLVRTGKVLATDKWRGERGSKWTRGSYRIGPFC